MSGMNILESLFRWVHVVFGILWIGHLYFFNWVNAQFAATLDADTKKKVVPELMPRALYMFRWGAAFTWVTGVLLLALVYYHTGILFESGSWNVLTVLLVLLVFVAPFVYDVLVSSPLKDLRSAFIGTLVVSLVYVFVMWWAGFSYRGYAIHLGAMFGTIMAYNVWVRIWPAQQRIIAATKEGAAPDPALVSMAGLRSRHNTYLSVPLVFLMLSQHAPWAANPVVLVIVVAVGLAFVYHMYDRAAQVKGF